MSRSHHADSDVQFTCRGPSGFGHVRFLLWIIRNYAEADLALFHRYGDVVQVRLPAAMKFFFQPRHVRHILRTNVRNYPKSYEYDMLRPLLGDGVFVSEGPLWTRQRRLLAPDFREQAVSRFLPPMIESAERIFAVWDAAPGEPVDVTHDMMRLTLWIVGQAMFERDFQEDTDVIGRSLEICLAHAIRQMLSMGLYPSWLPTRANREAAEAERQLDDRITRIILDTHASPNVGSGVVSSMARARDPDTGEAMSDQQMLDEIKSLILAGHETTSLALSWSLYLLSQHPDVEARLVDEVTGVLGERPLEPEDIPQLRYTRMVFLEAMRLYPPVPSMSRGVVEDDEIGGVHVRAGELVAISPYVTHRHPEHWSEPERFDPERFDEARADSIVPYSYMPFLLGRRACLGEHFAMLEGVALLAMLYRRYRFERVDQDPIVARPIITLRMDRPLCMRVHARAS